MILPPTPIISLSLLLYILLNDSTSSIYYPFLWQNLHTVKPDIESFFSTPTLHYSPLFTCNYATIYHAKYILLPPIPCYSANVSTLLWHLSETFPIILHHCFSIHHPVPPPYVSIVLLLILCLHPHVSANATKISPYFPHNHHLTLPHHCFHCHPKPFIL